MTRWLLQLAAALSALALAGALSGGAAAQGRADHPKLRAALQELREARKELQEARDGWPAGYKERALGSTQDAINSIRTILAVKDFDSFRGVDRDTDFYRRFKDHPRLRAALSDLREAREELRTARDDFGGQKERALDDIEAAIGDILALIRPNRR